MGISGVLALRTLLMLLGRVSDDGRIDRAHRQNWRAGQVGKVPLTLVRVGYFPSTCPLRAVYIRDLKRILYVSVLEGK